MEHFGKTLRAWREYRRFTVYGLAKAAGVYPNKISRIENAEHRNIYLRDAIRIAHVLGVTIEQLYAGIPPPSSDPSRPEAAP